MRSASAITKDNSLLFQPTLRFSAYGRLLSLALAALLFSVSVMPNIAFAGPREPSRPPHSHHGNGGHGTHHNGSHYDRHHHDHYRPYYPWGLGVATGWGLSYGWGRADWYDRTWNGGTYWHSPYSGIGLSIPLGYEDAPEIIATQRVTTSMQYSPTEARMVQTLPATDAMPAVQESDRNVYASTKVVSSNAVAANNAIARTPSRSSAQSLASLPSNARVVQRDGKILYEWQGIFYAFDWNTQTYRPQ